MTVAHGHHPVALRGPSAQRPGAPAVLVDLQAEDFVAALSAGLKRTEWPQFGWPGALPFEQLAALGAPRSLYQPIHRRFNLVLLDTHCAAFGTPRLDPQKIDSAGFVVRRWVGPGADDGMPAASALAHHAHWQAWLERDGEGLGWRGFASSQAFDADPDPARRALPRTGNAAIDAALAGRLLPASSETLQKLYPLTPDVCAHARRTLLFGLVPASEAQRTQRGAAVDYSDLHAAGPARDDFIDHLSPYLRRTGSARALPAPRGQFDASWLNDDDAFEANAPDPGTDNLLRAQFTAFVRQLALEFELGSPRAAPLVQLLDELTVVEAAVPGVIVTRREFGAADFLVACARVVTDPDAPAVPMPDALEAIPDGWIERFVDAALAVLEARSGEMRTLEGRYDDDALFAIRAFVRVKGGPGCPGRLVWSEMTPLYRIAPWHASTGSPMTRIALPSINAASLKAMKPNVAFELPPDLQSLLARSSPKSLLAGKGRQGSDVGLAWLCSFSIPIITICAFVALNIVLGLLDIVFQWIALVKICLPIPRKK